MIIGGILIIAGIALAAEGKWGGAAVAWVIAVFIIICWNAEKMDAKAWVNRTSYWAKSGKDRAKMRHQWEREARAEEQRELQARLDREQRKRDKQAEKELERVRKEYAQNPPPVREQPAPFESEVLKARYEGSRVNRVTVGRRIPGTTAAGAQMWQFKCYACGKPSNVINVTPGMRLEATCPGCGSENIVRFMM